jgi:hypothetical protein
MTRGPEELLRRLEEAKVRLLTVLEGTAPEEFAWESGDGRSVRRLLEELADRVNFFFAVQVARARGLPPPACLQRAQYHSPREAAISFQVVHRRLANLLHDLQLQDMGRVVGQESGEGLTLARLIEMAADEYEACARQLADLRAAYRQTGGGR